LVFPNLKAIVAALLDSLLTSPITNSQVLWWSNLISFFKFKGVIIVKKIQITTLSVILSSAILSSCERDEIQKWEEEKEQAITDAEFTDAQTHLDYLQCYALSSQEKSKCLLKLNNKKIKPELIKHHFYTNNYVYQLEKLGFVQFLKNKGAVCDRITEGPKYTSETESYVAKCRDGNIYLLKFNYEEDKWLLVK
jgi:hypothetical protein